MGEVLVEVRMENTIDRGIAKRGGLPDAEVRAWVGAGIVDTGAVLLAIPSEVADILGLDVLREAMVGLADGSNRSLSVAGPIELTVANRSMTTEAIVLPAGSEVLIGQIVLERLDLLVDCQNRTLVPRPEWPFYPYLKLKKLRPGE